MVVCYTSHCFLSFEPTLQQAIRYRQITKRFFLNNTNTKCFDSYLYSWSIWYNFCRCISSDKIKIKDKLSFPRVVSWQRAEMGVVVVLGKL